MTLRLNPYIAFDDTADEAMAFYQSVFGGDLQSMHFRDMDGMGAPEDADKVMHSMLTVDGGIFLMAADTPAELGKAGPTPTISLSGDDGTALRGWWDALSEGAEITTPLFDAPWGDTFGQLTDRFGVHWLMNIEGGARG